MIDALHNAFLRGQAAGLEDHNLQVVKSTMVALMQRKDARFVLGQAMEAAHNRIEGLRKPLAQAHAAHLPEAELESAEHSGCTEGTCCVQ